MDNNTKYIEIAKELVLSKYKKNTDLKKIENEIVNYVIWDEIHEYEERKKGMESEILKINSSIDSTISSFNEATNKNTSKIEQTVDGFKDFTLKQQDILWNIISELKINEESLSWMQKDLKKIDFVKEIKWIKWKYRDYTNNIKNDLIEHGKVLKEEIKQKLLKEYDEKKNFINEITDQKIDQENASLKERFKIFLWNIFIGDFQQILKYFLLILFTIWISVLDYFLIRDSILNEMNQNPQTASLIYKVIVPFIFSWWIIIWEYLNAKFIKWQRKIFFHIITVFVIVLSVLSSVYTLNMETQLYSLIDMFRSFEISQSFTLANFVVRIIVFTLLIPLDIFILNKLIQRDNFTDVCKDSIQIFFKVIVLPFIRCYVKIRNIGVFFRRIIKRKQNKKIFIDISNIRISHEKEINGIKENLQLSKLFKLEINQVFNQIHDMEKECSNLHIYLKNWKIVFWENLKNLDKNFKSIKSNIKVSLLEIINSLYSQIQRKEEMLNDIREQLGHEEQDIINKRNQVKIWIIQWFSLLNK